MLGVDRGLLLHAFDGGQNLALFYVIAFLHVEAGDAAKRRGAHVHNILGFDLAGAADHRGQILARHGGGEHLGISGLLLDHHEGYKPGGNQHSESNEEDFLHGHSFLGVDLLSSVREGEANGSVKSRLDAVRPAVERRSARACECSAHCGGCQLPPGRKLRQAICSRFFDGMRASGLAESESETAFSALRPLLRVTLPAWPSNQRNQLPTEPCPALPGAVK